MLIRRFIASSVFLSLLVSVFSATAADRPNIIVILADDFGVGDIQAHYPDNKIATPHLDRLVKEGMSFTDAHSPSAVCSPTRYGLLTGRYSWRTRMQEWVIAAYEPPLITKDRPTLPGFLKEHGYRTECVGKWHLGWDWQGPQKPQMTEERNGQKNLEWDFSKPNPGGPVDRGFDHYFGVDLPNMPPFTYIRDRKIVTPPTAKYVYDKNEGVVMPRTFDGAPMAPGWKFDQILPDITKHAVERIHELAKQDQPFFLYFSQTSPHEPVVPSARFKGKSGIAPIADFVMETDWSAGQIIEAVDKAGIAENTLILFTADNGHSHYTGWKDLVDAGHMPSGPYRGHKGDIWEGGHRVPLIVRWPGKVAAGSSSNQMVCLTDLFGTFAEVIGKPLPGNGAEDSFSFLHALTGKASSSKRTTMVNHSNFGEFAYREGNWKLVYRMSGKRLDDSRGKQTLPELYDLDADPAETTDLKDKERQQFLKMILWLRFATSGASTRKGAQSKNDTVIDVTGTQTQRWAPPRPEPQSDPKSSPK